MQKDRPKLKVKFAQKQTDSQTDGYQTARYILFEIGEIFCYALHIA